MMRAIVKKVLKSNCEVFSYIIVDDIINVVYTNENITLVKSDGTTVGYSNAITDDYEYAISIYIKE